MESVGRLSRTRSKYPVIAAGLLVLAALLADHLYPLNLPDDEQFARVIVDRDGRPLRAFPDDEGIWRYPVSVSQVSPLYLDALLAYEDRWYWMHPGVNPVAILRACAQNVRYRRIVSGGSTITMQVARLLHPHHRTIAGKLTQILRALQLEWRLSKTEILELYLNIAPFGGTIEGVQAASFTYFDKPAADLTHAEAALLAVLPQSPTRLRPDRHAERAELARNKVLDRLSKFEVWPGTVVREARLESVAAVHHGRPLSAPLLARRLLAHSDGRKAVRTTIDASLQSALEDYLGSYVQRLPERSSAAILVVENETLAVRAYLGSAVFGDTERYGHVDMIRATRSPGSTLKPFLYGLAMDAGYIHSHSLLADVPRTYGDYRPSNFSAGFSGPVSATDALQRSLNVPVIDLLERYGPRRFASRMRAAGVALHTPGDETPSLAIILGGVGTSLEQLVGTYSAFARRGRAGSLRYLADAPKRERFMMSEGSAWIIREILRGTPHANRLRTFASVGAKSQLAYKTGTSYGHRDAWAIGVSPDYTIGVWVGRPDGTPLPGHYGAVTAAPLLSQIAAQLPKLDSRWPGRPESVRQETICWPLGTAQAEQPADFCQERLQAWIVDGQIPPTHHPGEDGAWLSNPYRLWINPATGLRVDARCGAPVKSPMTVVLWPKTLEPWIPVHARRSHLIPRPDVSCPRPPPLYAGTLNIVGMDDGDIYRPPGVSSAAPTISLAAVGGEGRRYWYINGEFRYRAGSSQVIPHQFASAGNQQITVVDEQGNVDKVDVYIKL